MFYIKPRKSVWVQAQVYNPGPSEVEAGGLGTQGHSQLHKKYEVSLGYRDPASKKSAQQNETQKIHTRTLLLALTNQLAFFYIHGVYGGHCDCRCTSSDIK